MRFRFSKFFAPVSKVGFHEDRSVRRRRRAGRGKRRGAYERLEPRAMLTTLTVTNLGDYSTPVSGQLTLREAIAQANNDFPGDVIDFAAGLNGIISLTQGELPITQSMSIDGPGASVITVDAGQQSRVVDVYVYQTPQSSSLATVAISGLTLTHGNGTGYSTGGGAIFNNQTLALTDDIITASTCDETHGTLGGGICNEGTMTMTGNTVSNNAAVLGGGIYNGLTLTMSGNVITQNNVYTGKYSSAEGGGIYEDQVTRTLSSTGDTISDNSSSDYGGGIYSQGGTTLTGDTLSGNTATQYIDGSSSGGAVFGDASIFNSTISNNSAAFGGALYGGGTIINSSIKYNSARSGGGAIFVGNNNLFASGDDISDNTTTEYGRGGAIFVNTSTCWLENDTLYRNSAGAGGAISTDPQTTLVATHDTITANSASGAGMSDAGAGGGIENLGTFDLAGSIVVGNTGTTGADVDGAVAAGSGNLIGILASTVLATDGSGVPLEADNGGPTETVALAPGSPAIAGGAPLATLGAPIGPTDTSASVSDTTFIRAGDSLRIDDEIVTVTGFSGSLLAIVRAQDGTTGASHSTGADASLALDQRGFYRHATPDAGAFEDQVRGLAGRIINATEGAAFTGNVATFTAVDENTSPADYNANIGWGDAQASAGTISGPDSNGLFTVTGTNTYAEEGSFAVTVTIEDAGGASVTAASTASVSDAALTATGTTVDPVEGGAFTGTVATFTDADPAGAAADYTGTIEWGDGHTSTGSVSGPDSNGLFTVTGTNTYAEEGSSAVTITIEDAGGASATVTSTASVNDAALTATGTTVQSVEGTAFTGTVATFADADPAGAAADYTAAITWGDGHTSSGSVSGPDSNGVFTVTGANAYAEEGSFSATVTINDAGGASGTVTSTASVSDAVLTAIGATVDPVEGAAFTGAIATFSDDDPAGTAADYTATITWGDGHTSTGSVSGPDSNGLFTVTGTNTYAEEGNSAVTVTIEDAGGASATVTSTASVGDAVLTAIGATVDPVEGAAFTGAIATFSDVDPAGAAADYTAAITWGDGHTSTGSVSGPDSNGVFTVTGTNSYAEEASFPVTVTIEDAGGASATAASTASVSDAALTATGATVDPVEGAAFTGTVAIFADADPAGAAADYTAAITWGDGHTSAGSVSGPDSNGVFTVTGTNTYAEEASFPITVTINDAGGASATAASTASVSDAALTATGTTVHPVEGAAFTGAIATFSDADPAGAAADYTTAITWGDGHTSSGSVSGPDSNGLYTVTGTNTYAEEGSSAVTVTIDDAGGASATVTSSASVNDAPLSATGTTVHPVEGAVFTGTVATFTDADPAGAAADYTATITWGDGHTSSGSISGPGSTGFYTVTGTNTYAEEGNSAVTITIEDAGGASATVASTASVNDASLGGAATSIQPVQGIAFSGTLATFTDADPARALADYTATVNWGDGQTSGGAVSGPDSSGVFTVTGTHSYTQLGMLSTTVSVADVGGASLSLTGVSHVFGPPTGNTDVYVVSVSGSSSAGSSQAVLINDTDPNPNPHLSASLVSAPSNGTLAFNADGSFTYTPGAAFKGVDRFTYRAYDGPANGNNVTVTLYSHNGALVQKLYEEMLSRAALDSDIAYWAPAMDNGSETVSSIVQAIYSSNEYLSPKINTIYGVYLGSSADPNGLSYWENVWNTYNGPEQVIIGIATTDACFAHSGGTNTAWVTLLYNAILNRAPDSGGLNYFVTALNNGSMNRAQVVQSLVGSTEYHVDVIQAFFQEFLNRAASSSDLSYYESQFSNQLAVQTAIVGSTEYLNNPPTVTAGSVYKWQ